MFTPSVVVNKKNYHRPEPKAPAGKQPSSPIIKNHRAVNQNGTAKVQLSAPAGTALINY